jgi:hypothetical protein
MYKPKEKIRQLVTEAKLKEALITFADALSASDNVSVNDITLLSGQLTTLNKDFNEGIMSQADKDVRITKIAKSIIFLLDTWQQNDTVSDWERIFNTLPIDKDAALSVLQMVNCNRREKKNTTFVA